MKTTRPLVAIYCGSRSGNNPIYSEQAIELVKQLSQLKLGIVYGGASIGIMGTVADTAIAQQNEVLGVIPDFMLQYEIAHQNLTELQIVQTMHQRKTIMAERASAFIALAGGFGTYEEIFEIATWAQLKQHNKPMILFNINGFYDPLIQQLQHSVKEGFISQEVVNLLHICTTVEDVITRLKDLAV